MNPMLITAYVLGIVGIAFMLGYDYAYARASGKVIDELIKHGFLASRNNGSEIIKIKDLRK
tara:strand:+ start:5787 stop:5969 length:183 start_codon:yes stop_codon:yes gene_type:complete